MEKVSLTGKENISQADRIEYFTIANVFTILNLLFGFLTIAVLFLPDRRIRYLYTGIFILISVFCDWFDGFIARKRKESSEFGKQLDSIVDMVSFGLAPAIVFISKHSDNINFLVFLCGGIYISAAAIRLARFNLIDKADGKIQGLPTTVSGVFLALKTIVDHSLLRSASLVENGIILLILSFLMLGDFTLNKPGYEKEKE